MNNHTCEIINFINGGKSINHSILYNKRGYIITRGRAVESQSGPRVEASESRGNISLNSLSGWSINDIFILY